MEKPPPANRGRQNYARGKLGCFRLSRRSHILILKDEGNSRIKGNPVLCVLDRRITAHGVSLNLQGSQRLNLGNLSQSVAGSNNDLNIILGAGNQIDLDLIAYVVL